jgi:hypothetical protein
MGSYENEIRQALKADIDAGLLQELGAAEEVFQLLTINYPSSGSKIDWMRVAGSIECYEDNRSQERTRFVEFFDEMCTRFRLDGLVLYVCDGPIDFALAGAVDAMRRALPVLFEVPAHHYFVGPSASWCMSMTMEGGMAFGRAGVAPLH